MVAAARIYADHNASAPLRATARSAMLAALDDAGNATSIHAEGRAARARVEAARAQVAAMCGVSARNVTFASGASEAAATVLTPRLGYRKLIVFAGEHACVRGGGRFDPADVIVARSSAEGLIELDALEAALDAAGEPALVALQAANNETGAVQPVAQAAALARAKGGALVCDAAQAFGRIAPELFAPHADWVLASSHKIGGPLGAGAIVGRAPFAPEAALIAGGGQERGARGGTENAPALAGFGAAALEVSGEGAAEALRLASLRDRFEDAMRALDPELVIFAEAAPRLPNTSCLAFGGVSAETALMALDLSGVAASSGSACSSGKVGKSAVLAAMGVNDELARRALRFSFGWSTTRGEVDRLIEILREQLAKLLARRPRSAA